MMVPISAALYRRLTKINPTGQPIRVKLIHKFKRHTTTVNADSGTGKGRPLYGLEVSQQDVRNLMRVLLG